MKNGLRRITSILLEGNVPNELTLPRRSHLLKSLPPLTNTTVVVSLGYYLDKI